jgi:hypothetical protein
MSLINLKWDKEKDNIKSWALTPYHNTYIEDKVNMRSMIDKEKRFSEKNDRDTSLEDYFHENEEVLYNYSNSEFTRAISDILELKLTEAILGIDHINYSSEYRFKENASTITLNSGINTEEEKYRFSIYWDDYNFNKDTSTLEFRLCSVFLEKNFKISTVRHYIHQFHGIETTKDLIDVNQVYPPIGPPHY